MKVMVYNQYIGRWSFLVFLNRFLSHHHKEKRAGVKSKKEERRRENDEKIAYQRRNGKGYLDCIIESTLANLLLLYASNWILKSIVKIGNASIVPFEIYKDKKKRAKVRRVINWD